MTPTEYRKRGIDILIGNRQSAQMPDRSIVTHAGLHPEITVIPAVTIMGIRFHTTVSGNESVAAWQQFNKKVPAELLANKRYGVYEAGSTCSSDDFHTDSEASAFAGVEIPDNYPVPKDMKIKKLCGGTYAKFTHKGTVDTLIRTYHYIWGVWFPKSGFELAGRDDFECYTERFKGPDDDNSEIDIYFPVNV